MLRGAGSVSGQQNRAHACGLFTGCWESGVQKTSSPMLGFFLLQIFRGLFKGASVCAGHLSQAADTMMLDKGSQSRILDI